MRRIIGIAVIAFVSGLFGFIAGRTEVEVIREEEGRKTFRGGHLTLSLVKNTERKET